MSTMGYNLLDSVKGLHGSCIAGVDWKWNTNCHWVNLGNWMPNVKSLKALLKVLHFVWQKFPPKTQNAIFWEQYNFWESFARKLQFFEKIAAKKCLMQNSVNPQGS